MGDTLQSHVLKSDILDTELMLDQLVDVGTRLMAIIGKIAPTGDSYAALARPAAPSAPGPLQAEDLKRLLKLRGRQRRTPNGQFLEWPAWDMLLDLAAVQAENTHVSVSAVCISSGAPQSTALRKLAALESAGLVNRYLHGSDRRRVCLALTDEGAAFVSGVVAKEGEFFRSLG